jgi:hypothetical protein
MTTGDLPVQPVPSVAKAPPRARRSLTIAAALFCLLFALLWYTGVFGGNVRTIEPGYAYRCAQLTGFNYTAVTARWTGNDLASVLARDRVRTVINLRGGSPKDAWYRAEVAICQHHNAGHEDIPFSARHLPPPETVQRLLYVFDHDPAPFLIHCQAGADRTGLASTLYAHLYEHVPLDKAQQEELTWRYAHLPVDKTRAMDDFFELYRKHSDGLGLREWIQLRYPQWYAQSQIESR